MRLASGNVKKISLELGGKSPNIVFADADLEKFARESPYSVFDNTGQDCCARSRILVERSAHEQVVELFAGGDPGHAGRRPRRRGDRGRHARQLQAARPGPGLHRDRPRRGRDARRRRRRTRRSGPGRRARTSCRRSSTACRTTCASPARRSSGRSSRSSRSTPRRRPSGSRTPRRTACPGSIWSRDIGKALRAAKALQSGVHQRQLELVRPHRGAVRWLQDVRHRARARDGRARPLHRDEERLHRPELTEVAVGDEAARRWSGSGARIGRRSGSAAGSSASWRSWGWPSSGETRRSRGSPWSRPPLPAPLPAPAASPPPRSVGPGGRGREPDPP